MILDRPEEPGKKYALTFTILVHVGLVAALFLGVQWKRSQPEVMEVELWSSRPMPAQYVPPPPPPPPEPVVKPKPEPKPLPRVEPKPVLKKPDIAIKEEKKKAEPKKPEPKPKETPVPKTDPFKEMLEREERQRKASETQARLAAQADEEQRASANKRGLADYTNKIRIRIKSNLALPPGIQGNPEAVFEVTQLPTAEILAVKLKHSSGNPALDSAIERAIRKSSPLPKPDNPSLFERTLEIKYKPFEE